MRILELLPTLLLSFAELVIVAGAVWLVHRDLQRRYKDRPDQQFRSQMILVGVALFAVLLIILILPISGQTRGSLLSLFGVVVSATIALSSTNLVGNIMAGIMLRTVGSFKLGDYIKVGDYFGRVSEMDLLHTEIQTEDRDLTTLPNSYLASNLIQVMRASGTIIAVEVSLGYDVSRHEIEPLLLEAAAHCRLERPFVQIRALGDYSITYAVAGLLTDLKKLLGTRRALRAATIDVLHDAGIEIASPMLISTREFKTTHQFLTSSPEQIETRQGHGPDTLVFDKAMQAESLDKLRERRTKLKQDISNTGGERDGDGDLERMNRQLERLDQIIAKREADIAKSD
ncbi:MAG: mechanosensitive ion channel family protein [Pseudomonadota bacterium]